LKKLFSRAERDRQNIDRETGAGWSDIALMAHAAERAGADAVSLINTFVAMPLTLKPRKPVLANKTGGLSGPCVSRSPCGCLGSVRRGEDPVLGMGGILNADDALEFLIAGASALQSLREFYESRCLHDILHGHSTLYEKRKGDTTSSNNRINNKMTNKLIVALDVPSLNDAEKLVKPCHPQFQFSKSVWSFLHLAAPKRLRCPSHRAKVFLDLKFHDIRTASVRLVRRRETGVFM